MMSSLLNGFPQKRKACAIREGRHSCGPKIPYKKSVCAEPSAKPAEEASLTAADNNAPNLNLSGSAIQNSSEFQQLVDNCVESEMMKSEMNYSLYAWVGKVVTSSLKANGVDLSSIPVEKVLKSIAQETSKQLLGVGTQAGAYENKSISEIGSTSTEKMLPAVAGKSFPPHEGHMDIGSSTEMSCLETKLARRRVPPFCGRNAPRPTVEERSRIMSDNKMKGKEVIAGFSREVSWKKKKLELATGNNVICVSAQEMFPGRKKLEELGRPLKVPGRNDSTSNQIRKISSSSKEKTLVTQSKPLNSTIGLQQIDMREKVRHTLALFRGIIEELSQQEKYIRRVDLEAAKIIRDSRKEVNTERQWIGSVPGVEVGDKFFCRAELMVVGIHRHPQGGIDYVKNGSMIVATSVIASGGYSDNMANSDKLIYSGQGGNITGRKNEPPKDQKMERGYLALRNCISTRTEVRVKRGFETKASSLRARMVTYTYDGLYTVEKFWSERGQHGKLVFMFELKRVSGQQKK